MSVFTYPPPITVVVNNHRTQLADFPLRIVCANPDIISTPPDCTPCDPIATLPFIDGDIFYFQFRSGSPLVSVIITFFKADGTIISVNVLPVSPILTANGYIHNINIPAPLLINLFYIKIQLGAIIHYTTLYCRVVCDDTLLLEGTYSKTDCSGYDYTSGYRNLTRLNGILTKTAFSIEVEMSANQRRTYSQTGQTFNLQLGLFDTHTESILERIFAAQRVLINGEDYEFSGEIQKNLDLTKLWASDIQLTKTLCKTTYNC